MPTPDHPLFTAAELSDWLSLETPVSEGIAVLRERVVWGWLKGPLKLDERPEDLTDEVFAWALELGGIAHENPTAFSGKRLDDYQETYSFDRRSQILREVEAYAAAADTAGMSPRGSFPAANRYPDPAFACTSTPSSRGTQ